ncbi:hypothetical protein BDU57DRAFT_543939 [Ampelomyces quisqualis]|uniref:Uncharacterized protein n=1 Tax=Ampelomyces quisqualis TaxID=50730 RepID=A0A6A5QZU9_AMPQU|nr:hypothetical protein BDU57DRAFT_543939 [Ampelomyces quisqualis]
MFEQISKHQIRRKYTHEEKHKHKEAVEQARKRGQGTGFPPAAYESGSNSSTKSRTTSSRPKQTTPTTSGYPPSALPPACSAPKSAQLHPDDKSDCSLSDTELDQMVDFNVAREVEDAGIRTFDDVPINQISSGYRLHESEATHELELERLMTLNRQRNCTFSASSNPLERLLSADDFSATLLDDPIAPAICASHEFILGMQHEQSELWAKTEGLEAQMADLRRTSKAASCSRFACLEKMLGLTIALSFELLLEEGAFRDMYEKKHRCEEFDLGRVFAQMRTRVGLVIEEYDCNMERLREVLAKQ